MTLHELHAPSGTVQGVGDLAYLEMMDLYEHAVGLGGSSESRLAFTTGRQGVGVSSFPILHPHRHVGWALPAGKWGGVAPEQGVGWWSRFCGWVRNGFLGGDSGAGLHRGR